MPPPAPTEAGRWVQDLRWMARVLKRWHPDPYRASGREVFHDEVEGLAARMEELTVPGRVLGFMRVLAHIGDSHTHLFDLSAIADPHLPFSVEAWGDEFWITLVQESHRELDATRIVAIEGRSMQEVVRRLGVLVPFENQISLTRGAAYLMPLPRALREVGLVDDLERVRLRLRDRHGVEFDVEVEALPAGRMGPWVTSVPRPEAPRGYREDELWWWEPLPAAGALYLQYNRCRDSETAPHFADLASDLLARLDAGGFERVIVDLRHNTGGDSRVLLPLRKGLAARGVEVLVLIGPPTYSSGVLNAWQLATEAGATLWGEPTGGRPNHFGEIRRLELPYSSLVLFCSTKTFHLVPGDPDSLEPDRLVRTTYADLLAGRDPVIEAILTSLR